MTAKRLDGPMAASQVHRERTLRESRRPEEKGEQLHHDEARPRGAAVWFVKEGMLSLEGRGRHRRCALTWRGRLRAQHRARSIWTS